MLKSVDYHNRIHRTSILFDCIFHHICHYEINANNRWWDINPMDHVWMYIRNYRIDIEHNYIPGHIDYCFVLMNNYWLNIDRHLRFDDDVYSPREFHKNVRRNSLDIDKKQYHQDDVNKHRHSNTNFRYIDDLDNLSRSHPVDMYTNTNQEYSTNKAFHDISVDFIRILT